MTIKCTIIDIIIISNMKSLRAMFIKADNASGFLSKQYVHRAGAHYWCRTSMRCGTALCMASHAFAAGPGSSTPDNAVPLYVTPPVYIYRAPGAIVTDAVPASGASEVEIRTPPTIERPDNWACRTANVLTRSSIQRTNEGKTISDYEHLMPKC
jgi:hypothetical protein